MIDLLALDEPGLVALLARWNQPAFRARQLRAWLYERGAASFEDMTDLPGPLRTRLAAEARIGAFVVTAEQQSRDGTVKRLVKMDDGQQVETVLMPYADGRRTACISSQAGCAMGCVFCATGQMGFARHLTEAEIFGQAARFASELKRRGERLSNVVLMGMGEPFHNYDAAVATIRRLSRDLGIGARHITVSTVGIVPGIRRFAREGLQTTLAISLHAATDEERSAMLPVNRRWPLAELIDAIREYTEISGRRVSFEWALVAGRTDSADQAERLANLVAGIPCHVNAIPLNPTRGFDGAPTLSADAAGFVDTLTRRGIPATVRVRRGIDIDAGCGQLHAEVQRKERRAHG